MANETQIIGYINSELLGAMSDAHFAGSKAYGITEIQERVKEKLPAETTKQGELIYVGIDDTHPVIFYHRSYGSQILPDKQNSFGNGHDLIETSNMGLIVFAQRHKIKMNANNFKDYLVDAMPINISKANAQILKIKSAFIRATGSDFNSLPLYKREYQVSKKLDPRFFLLEIKYSIECRFNKMCPKTFCRVPGGSYNFSFDNSFDN